MQICKQCAPPDSHLCREQDLIFLLPSFEQPRLNSTPLILCTHTHSLTPTVTSPTLLHFKPFFPNSTTTFFPANLSPIFPLHCLSIFSYFRMVTLSPLSYPPIRSPLISTTSTKCLFLFPSSHLFPT